MKGKKLSLDYLKTEVQCRKERWIKIGSIVSVWSLGVTKTGEEEKVKSEVKESLKFRIFVKD